MKYYLFVLTFLLSIASCKKELVGNTNINGNAFGTTYSIIYNSDEKVDLESQFDSIFYVINKSMSTYQTNSIISKFNRNENVKIDDHFIKVFDASKIIYKTTNGVFDPTIGVMVNAWDFGPEGTIENLDSIKIKSLMESVDFNNSKQVWNCTY